MTASAYGWFINVRTALFFGMNKAFSDITKKLTHRTFERQLKKPKVKDSIQKLENVITLSKLKMIMVQ